MGKKKGINIIGGTCFKFEIKMIEEENNNDDYMEVEWTLQLFCINCDYLIPYSSYYNYYNQIEGHYFLNCDCYKRKDDKKENKQKNIICYYNISDDRILKSPRILKKEDKIMISNWIKPNSEIKFRLIFQTSKNGNLISTFYNKVNDISPTLILIKSKAGHIFGGYTSVTWEQTGIYKKDENSFLFSLDNKKKYPIKKDYIENAIYGCSSYFAFGGGFDLLIYDQFTETNFNFCNITCYNISESC